MTFLGNVTGLFRRARREEASFFTECQEMIVCLGWGSLVWDPRDLPVRGEWHHDGPALPLEFARESGNGRITLVVVDQGQPVPTLWAELDVPDIESAVKALFEREGAEWLGSIGRWPVGARGHRHLDVVRAWVEERGFDGVVWTDLQPGMKGDRKREPSLDDVLRHLEGLDPDARESADEYVRRAPDQIATPHRAAIEALLLRG